MTHIQIGSLSFFAGQRPSISPEMKDFFCENEITSVVNLTKEDYSAVYNRLDTDLNVVKFPIEDQSVPINMAETNAIMLKMLDLVKEHSVYIHCERGKGRTGLFSACLIAQHLKIGGQEAINKIREFIPQAIETLEQTTFVNNYAALFCQNLKT